MTLGFIPRNDSSLIIVKNWPEFVNWAKDEGYDESYLDINDSKCYELQVDYIELMAIEEGRII